MPLVGEPPSTKLLNKLYGEGSGDLLAAGGGCAGGAIVGGPGKDDASFAETQAHPGLLIISFPKNAAWVDEIKGCDSVRLDDSNEDMEGSFDWDVLIGDGGPNAMLGQPGEDRFYGNGGDDIIDARDGVRDFSIQCGKGEPPKKITQGKGSRKVTRETKGTGKPAGRAITDDFDPKPFVANRRSLRARRIPHTIPERDDVRGSRAKKGSRGGSTSGASSSGRRSR